jgi:DNA adenine methylase
MKPLLKWLGNKAWLAPRIHEFWDTTSPVAIPFSGSAAVELFLSPSNCLSNDINPLTSNFHRQVQRGLSLPIWDTDRQTFEQKRDRLNQLIATGGNVYSPECAMLYWYINKAGFNGLLRFNQAGLCNTPWGDRKSLPVANAWPYREVMKDWKITSVDFEQLPIEPGTFIYADPPYDGAFVQYSTDGFDWDDQVRLAEWLAAHEGQVMASNAWTDRIAYLYERLGFDCHQVAAPRFVSCNGNREKAQELLAVKPAAPRVVIPLLGDSSRRPRVDALGRGRPGHAHGYTDTVETHRRSIRKGKEVCRTYYQSWYYFEAYGWKSSAYIPKGLKGRVDAAIAAGEHVEDILSWLSPRAYQKLMNRKRGLAISEV